MNPRDVPLNCKGCNEHRDKERKSLDLPGDFQVSVSVLLLSFAAFAAFAAKSIWARLHSANSFPPLCKAYTINAQPGLAWPHAGINNYL